MGRESQTRSHTVAPACGSRGPQVTPDSRGTQGEVTAPQGSPGDVGVLHHGDTELPTPSLQSRRAQTSETSWPVLSSAETSPASQPGPGAAAVGIASRSWAWLPVSFPLPRLPPCQAAISPAFTGLREDDSAASQTTLGTNVQSVPRSTPHSPGRSAELQGMP